MTPLLRPFCDRVMDVFADACGIYGPLLALLALAIVTPLAWLAIAVQGCCSWLLLRFCEITAWLENKAFR